MKRCRSVSALEKPVKTTPSGLGYRAPRYSYRVLGLTLLLACTESDSVAPPLVRANPEYLTGAAAAAVGSDGLFDLEAPAETQYPILTRIEAERLALGFVKEYAPSTLARFEAQHGGPMDLESLQPCLRSLYAESPYVLLPDGAPRYVVRASGPQWVVTLCSARGVPQLKVAVAAFGTDIVLEGGRLAFGPERGGEFFPSAIPLGSASPVSPERAVEIAATISKRRITSVPRLMHRGSGFSGLGAVWQLRLESPARFESESGEIFSADVVYVGEHLRRLGAWKVYVASTADASMTDTVNVYDAAGVSPRALIVARRPGFPPVLVGLRAEGAT